MISKWYEKVYLFVVCYILLQFGSIGHRHYTIFDDSWHDKNTKDESIVEYGKF